MKQLKLLFLFLAIGTLPLFAQEPDPYALTKVTLQNNIFFTMSPAEKQALLDKVKMLHEIPEEALLQPDKAVILLSGKERKPLSAVSSTPPSGT